MATSVLARIETNPHLSIRKLAAEAGMSIGSIHKTLTVHKYHPYKLILSNSLNEDDPDRRIEYCENIQNRCNIDSTFITKILFTDEASFYLNSKVCRHNSFYWSQKNPNWVVSIYNNDKKKVQVWAGIIGNKIIGPIFFKGI
jgi:hypothetical protein